MDCFSSMDNARRVKLWRVIAAFSIIPIEECRTVTHTHKIDLQTIRFVRSMKPCDRRCIKSPGLPRAEIRSGSAIKSMEL